MSRWICVLGLSIAAAIVHAQDGEKPLREEIKRVPPKSPAEAGAAFETLHGFTMDLLAGEPLVTDPIAGEYDEDGRLWIVEMGGYPYQKEKGTPPVGKVRILEDTNADGKFDKSHLFADKLEWATGLALWKGGVFIAAAPDIFYFKDTDGDFQADHRETVYTGFGFQNVQALVNNLKWGPDGKIYGATAGNGGEIKRPDKPDAPAVSVRGRDFRFDPATREFEAISGTSQYGNSFDDWYNRFVCNNSNHAQHVVLPSHYLERNPYLAVPAVITSIGKDGESPPVYRLSEPESWRVVRTRRRIAEGKMKAGPLVEHDVFTSACSVTIYRGVAYPPEFHGNLFVSDVQGNLIHRKTLKATGATFVAERADAKAEIVRSSDNWFRPVNYINAPDGTLHVLDMYRETIEHPWSIPEDIKALLDLEAGQDRGRVYRLTPPGFKAGAPPRLGSTASEELARQLENPNAWWRETAQRLLIERQDKRVQEQLRDVARGSQLPQGRMHALWTLATLGELTESDVIPALLDASPRVRENAVVLTERWLDKSAALLERVIGLADDADQRVRMQVAFTLGFSRSPKAVEALAKIARRDGADVWVRTAVLSSASESAATLFKQLVADAAFSGSPAGSAVLAQLAFVTGARNKTEEVRMVLGMLLASLAQSAATQRAVLTSLGDGLKRARSSLSHVAQGDPAAKQLIDATVEHAKQLAIDAKGSVGSRAAAIGLLSYAAFADVRDVLEGLIDSRQPQEVQLAAIHALAGYQQPEVADLLLERWRTFSPGVRAETLEVLLSRPAWASVLLAAVEKGAVLAGQIPSTRTALLLKHPDAKLRAQATRLFGDAIPSPRQEVIAKYRPVLAKSPDAVRGEKVFERECLTCHKVQSKGFDVGPNLATVQNRTADNLLLHILDPNREVLPNYVDYVIASDDGSILTGIVAAETATSVTLKRAQNQQSTILRQNIETMSSTGKSLMPEEIEKKIAPEEMADLIAFLLSLK